MGEAAGDRSRALRLRMGWRKLPLPGARPTVCAVQRDGRAGIDIALVERLIASQFPQWRGVPVTPVELDGWDNRTYRLGGKL